MLETDKHNQVNHQETHNEIYKLLHSIFSKDGKHNLYEHLEKLYETKMELNDDNKFIDLFEDISIRIKHEGKYMNEENIRYSLYSYLGEFNKNAKKKKALIDPLAKLEEDGTLTPITSVAFVPEYHSIFQILEWIGLSLGDKEAYLLTNSLRNLSYNKSLPNGAVFWGKIYGTEKDYYIAEATGVESQGKQYNIFILIRKC
jgi:radial spoke head protein 4A